MDTPICDFVRDYADKDEIRLHMPGHKGKNFLGLEALDITEIDGADSLYEASSIIRQSEENASALFGCPTFYSTEGSSQCIRAMLYLAVLHARTQGKNPVIATGRNAHKTFLTGAALLDLDVRWLYPKNNGSYLSCNLTAEEVEVFLQSEQPTAVYLTSPDYLGNAADIAGIAEVCHKHGAILLVDNAHGAYLKFLRPSRHPMDLGADLCCDSAHKTLPVLTGGAYLHCTPEFRDWAKNALALFGSTSPSYLILQSLDMANPILSSLTDRLSEFIPHVDAVKENLSAHGYVLSGQEPLKITISAKPYGYTGQELTQILLKHNIVSEFADPDFLVLMLTPENSLAELNALEKALLSIPRKPPILEKPPTFQPGQRVCSPREAMLSPMEEIPVEESEERILAAATVGCPPAVPIVVSGERIDAHAISCFQYYGITHCSVMK
ncbi:MAG: aminotransferase class V-fold PLP-dependent enzyme [Eubacteriales bacterium]|nr:aminotransferase class V-fold PLP-dependent enzyme [Eubacteriales bacterium]